MEKYDRSSPGPRGWPLASAGLCEPCQNRPGMPDRLAATQSLWLAADFTPGGHPAHDAGEEGPGIISTDGDPQLFVAGRSLSGHRVALCGARKSPQAVMLYWKTPGQTDFPRQNGLRVQTARRLLLRSGRREGERGAHRPGQPGRRGHPANGVVFDPDLSLLAAFLPGAGEGMLCQTCAFAALAVFWPVPGAGRSFEKKARSSN